MTAGASGMLAPSGRRGAAHGAADGLWWRVGEWMPRAAGPGEPASPRADLDGGRARHLRERHEAGRDWAEALVRERLDGRWPGFRADHPGRKPRLLGDHGLDVSISHSGTTMLVAVSRGAPVGVDIEVAPFEAFARPQLVRRMCSAAELEVFASVPDGPIRRRALARAWTVKEATLKASGIGLAQDPRRVEVDARAILSDPEHGSREGALDTAPEWSIVRLLASGAELRHPNR
ncbi:4'-phosphopantetheinyl transferase family protein [Agromyces sp. NPDC058110]|uniref:4'-phosphopantetheinyl transferase family protein n=1 Tax=Agromyces sp. NPDC058110 TaxID=3346345 RepID=UPI0036DDA927